MPRGSSVASDRRLGFVVVEPLDVPAVAGSLDELGHAVTLIGRAHY